MVGDSRPAEVLVVGFGGVGTLYAFLLHQAGAKITAVCRSNYEVVKNNGIEIKSARYGNHAKWHPDRVVQSADEVVDTAETIRPFLEKNASFSPVVLPLIVLIQNGIDIEDEVYTAFVTSEKPLASGVVSGVTWVGVTLLGNGTRIEHGALERLKLGVYPAPLEESVPETTARPFERLVALFKKGESDVEATNDITAVRWSKLLWNVSWGGLAVVARQPLAAILDAEALPYTCGVVRGIMLELITIARAHGISEARLPSSLVDHTYEFTLKNSHADIRLSKDPARYFETQPGSSLPGDFKPSILVDLERQRPMELDPIFGHLLKRAREANVDTPRLDLIAAALKPSQLQFIRKAQEEEHNNVYVAYPAQNQTGGAPVL